MRKHYDFSKAKPNPYVKGPKKKVTRRLMKFLDARGKQTKTVNAADVKKQLNLD